MFNPTAEADNVWKSFADKLFYIENEELEKLINDYVEQTQKRE